MLLRRLPFRRFPLLLGLLLLLVLGPQSSYARETVTLGNAMRYADPRGDASGGLDITNVNVSNTDNGVIHFSIEVPSHERLPLSSYMSVYLDVDRNRGTGQTNAGWDYSIWIDATRNTIRLFEWAPAGFRETSAILAGSFFRGETINIDRGYIRSPSSFDFMVATFRSDARTTWDMAPTDRWTYNVVIGSGQPQPSTQRLALVGLNTSPNLPRAGSKFYAAVGVALYRTGEPARRISRGRVSCVAMVSGRRMPLARATVQVGGAICGWTIASSARGRTLVVVITVRSEGLRVTKRYRFKVR